MSESILYTVKNAVATITINRLEKLNALAGTMREDIYHCLTQAEQDATVRVVVITGTGKAFCVGGDIQYMIELRKKNDFEKFRQLLEMGCKIVQKLRTMPKIVVAKINGTAAGAGLNLALACDLRIASDKASFGETFIKIGLQLDWGGTYHLVRLVGQARAAEMILSGSIIDAHEAERIGLLNQVVEHERLDETVAKLAEKLAKAPAVAVQYVKKGMNKAIGGTLEEVMAYETESQLACFNTRDFAEGLRAFVEKREPRFQGK